MSCASPTTPPSAGAIVISRQPSFKERLQTLRVQHAVAQGGQHILLLVFTTLFLGDLTDIKGSLEQKLGSRRQYKDSFTKPEQDKLEVGNYQKWDISLLYKLLQKVCGLNEKVSEWKQSARETLEKLLDELKELRNELAHNFDSELTEKERDEKLEALRALCLEILIKLNERAQIGDEAVHKHYEAIEYMLNDTKKPINETSFASLQTDSTAAAISKSADSSPASPTFGFGASSASSLIFGSATAGAPASAGLRGPALAGLSGPAFAATASAIAAVVEGFSPASVTQANYDHDSAEAMDVDDRYEATSWEKFIINQLEKQFWEFAGPQSWVY